MVFVAPTSRPTLNLSAPLTLLSIGPVATDFPSPPFVKDERDGGADRRASGSTVPAHPDETFPVDPAPFVRKAGLHDHVGVTVVLRVEVHGTGVVGRVEVDVSGGSKRVDQAAIAYVRAMQWVGGQVDNQPATLWVRWGVRFNG